MNQQAVGSRAAQKVPGLHPEADRVAVHQDEVLKGRLGPVALVCPAVRAVGAGVEGCPTSRVVHAVVEAKAGDPQGVGDGGTTA